LGPSKVCIRFSGSQEPFGGWASLDVAYFGLLSSMTISCLAHHLFLETQNFQQLHCSNSWDEFSQKKAGSANPSVKHVRLLE
jgi:hypothetical protein